MSTKEPVDVQPLNDDEPATHGADVSGAAAVVAVLAAVAQQKMKKGKR